MRNYAGFTPLAAGRGLPAGLPAGLRAELERPVAAGDMECVSRAELAVLDSSVTPEHYAGRLTWSAKSLPSRFSQQLVPEKRPAQVREAVGAPPAGWSPAVERLERETGDLAVCYQSLSVGTVLGSGSHWPHVFAVMSVLAGRFGDDGVRLVVAFG